MNRFTGRYTLNGNGGQWLGTTILLQAGDVITLTGDEVNQALLTVTGQAGGNSHLTGRSGLIKFREDGDKAIGVINAPEPNGGADMVDYYLAVRVSGTAPNRRLKITVLKAPGPSDDNGGEHDGEEGP